MRGALARSRRRAGLPGTIHDTVDAIEAAGGTALAVRCDIGDEADIAAPRRRRPSREFGRLDVLVNNAMAPTAGARSRSRPSTSGTSRCASTCAASTCSRSAVAPHMVARRRRQHHQHLVGAAPRTRRQPFMPPGYLIYSVAKAALERFTSAVAPELRAARDHDQRAAARRGQDRDDRDSSSAPDADWTRLGDARRRSCRRSRVAGRADRHRLHRPGRSTSRGFGTSWPDRARATPARVARVTHASLRHRAAGGRAVRAAATSCACTCAGSRRTTRRTSATPATYLTYDLLIRRLEELGHEVRMVRNITDVDDSILPKARELGVPVPRAGRGRRSRASTATWPRSRCARRSRSRARPRRSPQIIDLVGRLLDSGHAYLSARRASTSTCRRSPTSASSRTTPKTGWCKLARARGGNPDDPHRRTPLDFVLWQPSLADEPAWRAPFGAGRPGWHIECSAMAMHEHGPTLDLHGGGTDLDLPAPRVRDRAERVAHRRAVRAALAALGDGELRGREDVEVARQPRVRQRPA